MEKLLKTKIKKMNYKILGKYIKDLSFKIPNPKTFYLLSKNIVNYKNEFGDNYKKLCFIFARDRNTHVEINSEDIDSLFVSENYFLILVIVGFCIYFLF